METPSEEKQYLKIIHHESERIEQLVNDLFVLAQADEGVLKIVKEPVQLETVVREAAERIQTKAKEKGLFFHLFLGDFPKVVADPRRIEQVMFNLLDNSIRYTPEGGTISVHMSEQDKAVEVTVTDTGIGIPEDELPYIWDRLYRVEKSRSRARGGTGLGLAIVKQIVELHGGTVRAESTDQVGTTIAYTIPIGNEEVRQKGDGHEEN